MLKKVLLVVGVIAVVAAVTGSLNYLASFAMAPVHDPPVTVHDGSLSVDFKFPPKINNGIYTAETKNITAISIAPEYELKPSGPIDQSVCDSSAPDCPALNGNWEIDVCDLHDQGPYNGHACSHGVAICSSMKSDHSCNVGGLFPSSSTTVSVVSISDTDTLELVPSTTAGGVTRYKNKDSDDMDPKKCPDANHQCDFPGYLYVTHRGTWSTRTDNYQCQTTATSSNGDPVCRVQITDRDARPAFFPRLQTQLKRFF